MGARLVLSEPGEGYPGVSRAPPCQLYRGRDGTCGVPVCGTGPLCSPLQPGERCGGTPEHCVEKGQQEGSASFCFLRTKLQFSQCLRALPRPPYQGSKDSGKEARLSWWQEVPGKAVGKMETMPCPTGCEAPRPSARSARRKDITPSPHC